MNGRIDGKLDREHTHIHILSLYIYNYIYIYIHIHLGINDGSTDGRTEEPLWLHCTDTALDRSWKNDCDFAAISLLWWWREIISKWPNFCSVGSWNLPYLPGMNSFLLSPGHFSSHSWHQDLKTKTKSVTRPGPLLALAFPERVARPKNRGLESSPRNQRWKPLKMPGENSKSAKASTPNI